MQRPDSLKYQLLELIGISGEFPAEQLNRLISSPSYAEKVITELKKDKLIRTHYRDKLRGYRLTKKAKDLLLSANYTRYHYYLEGNTETNLIRSERSRRIRLHKKAETYLTLLHSGIPLFPDEKPDLFSNDRKTGSACIQDLPLFYSSREIKELGAITTKIKNSRSIGVLLAPHCVYAVYNTSDRVLKWEYKTEIRLNAFLQHYLQDFPYSVSPTIRAIMLGKDMDIVFRLMTSTGGYRRSLFMLDTSYEHFHYLPNNAEGETLLKLLTNPKLMVHLNQLLLSDLHKPRNDIPIEHDAVTDNGTPSILAYDFDMQRINRFNTGLNVYGKKGNLICFDFQIPILQKYLSADIYFSSIDLAKFRKGLMNEP